MAKHPGGRPTKYKKDFHPDSYLSFSNEGYSKVRISREWNVSTSTIQLWGQEHPEFSAAMARGLELVSAWYEEKGIEFMSESGQKHDASIFKHMTTHCAKWSTPDKSMDAQVPKSLAGDDATDEELES